MAHFWFSAEVRHEIKCMQKVLDNNCVWELYANFHLYSSLPISTKSNFAYEKCFFGCELIFEECSAVCLSVCGWKLVNLIFFEFLSYFSLKGIFKKNLKFARKCQSWLQNHKSSFFSSTSHFQLAYSKSAI